MSNELEQLVSQKMAFDHKPTQPWHRHLITQAELKMLFDKARKYDDAMHRIARMVEERQSHE